MLYKVETRSTRRYKYTELAADYFIDVTTTADSYEAWIMEKDSGVAALMFEVPFRQPNGDTISYEGFMELVIGNLEACGAWSYLIDEGR